MKRFLMTAGMIIMLLALLCVPAYAAGGNGSGGGNGGGGGNSPLTVESVQCDGAALAGAELAAGEVTVTITFSRGMDAKFDANKEAIQVLDAEGNAVETEIAIVDGSKEHAYAVTFTAEEGAYILCLGADLTANNDKTLGEDETYDFTVKAAEPTPEPTPDPTPEPTEKPAYDECAKDDACPIAAFKDAQADAWYHDGVHFCLDNAIMNGVGEDTFAPTGNITRAMIVTMLYRMEGSPAPKADCTMFFDVDSQAYYMQALSWAYYEDIVNGLEPHTFGPNVSITREQFATILYRYAEYKGIDVSVGEDTNILSYDDALEVGEWANAAMRWAVGVGLINGRTESTLVPQGTASRAEAATIFMRFCTQDFAPAEDEPVVPKNMSPEDAEYQIEVAMQYKLGEMYGDKVNDARIYVEKIYTAQEEQEEEPIKALELGPDEYAFMVRYELHPAEGVDVEELLPANGKYNEESGWVVNKTGVGVLRPNESGEPEYIITNFGTGF